MQIEKNLGYGSYRDCRSGKLGRARSDDPAKIRVRFVWVRDSTRCGCERDNMG